MNDFDRLIQLCDSLATAEGICLMEKRLVNVAIRHGVTPETPAKWKATLDIFEDFSSRAGRSLYTLFDDVIPTTFGIN